MLAIKCSRLKEIECRTLVKTVLRTPWIFPHFRCTSCRTRWAYRTCVARPSYRASPARSSSTCPSPSSSSTTSTSSLSSLRSSTEVRGQVTRSEVNSGGQRRRSRSTTQRSKFNVRSNKFIILQGSTSFISHLRVIRCCYTYYQGVPSFLVYHIFVGYMVMCFFSFQC